MLTYPGADQVCEAYAAVRRGQLQQNLTACQYSHLARDLWWLEGVLREHQSLLLRLLLLLLLVWRQHGCTSPWYLSLLLVLG
jgi:hypothetical protein